MSDSVLRIDSPDAAKWTEAICLLDGKVPVLAESDDLVFRVKTVRGRTKLRVHSRLGRAYWHDAIGVWVRYSCGFNWKGVPSKSKRRAATTTASIAEIMSAFADQMAAAMGDDYVSLFSSLALSSSVPATGADLTVENLSAANRIILARDGHEG